MAKDPITSTYTVYIILAYETDYKNTMRTSITRQLTHMQNDVLSAYTTGLEALRVSENSMYLAQPELDDDLFTITIQVITS